jgi:O-antigen ligase
LFLATLTLKTKPQFQHLANGFLIVATINIIYSLLVLATGKDIIPWTNPYKTILGTFGNPNFLSSFLGISVSIFAVWSLDNSRKKLYRFSSVLAIPFSLFLIDKTNSLQGFLIVALTLSLLSIIWIQSSKFSKINYFLIPSFFASGVSAILGMLQIGPLANYLYKDSVTYRGEYWQAGLNMANSSPLVGVGFDSYGDLFRQFRDAAALVRPGVDVVTNTAHNVYIDILASGGYPLFIAYAGIQLFALISAIKAFSKIKGFDPTFTGIFLMWIGYQAQSLISINQIGLAVWGWVSTAALIAYSHSISELGSQAESSNGTRKKTNPQVMTHPIAGTMVISGMVIGFLIISPLVLTEANWRNSLEKGSLPAIEQNIGKFPKVTARYQFGILHLGGNQLGDLAYKYAKEAVSFNPNDYQTWRILIKFPQTTESEKQNAKVNLRRLDPLNPEWK